jgi:hypothetical protein
MLKRLVVQLALAASVRLVDATCTVHVWARETLKSSSFPRVVLNGRVGVGPRQWEPCRSQKAKCVCVFFFGGGCVGWGVGAGIFSFSHAPCACL